MDIHKPLHLRTLDISSHVLPKAGRTRIDKVSKDSWRCEISGPGQKDTYSALTPPQPYVKTLGLVRAIPPPLVKRTPAALIRFRLAHF